MSKEAISKIREVLGEDSSKVETHLKEIEGDYKEYESTVKTKDSEIEDLRSDISHVNTESKNRKLKIRELTQTIDDQADKIKELEDGDQSGTVKELQTKLKRFEDAEKAEIDTKAKSFIDTYEKLKIHADWDKSKDKFTLPEEKDGKMDWESVDVNIIAQNADKLNEYKGLGLFEGANPDSEGKPDTRQKGKDSTVQGPFTDDDFN